MVKAVMFDFGGVLAEEGFREGLRAIAENNGLTPGEFFGIAEDLIYKTGYVTGMTDEAFYLNALRGATGIIESNEEIKHGILQRFILRPEVIGYADELRSRGLITAILSDQTNWLDEINAESPFFHHFDYVFNSFRLKKGKRDPSVFRDVCAAVGQAPGETVFIDDNPGNIGRALKEGLHAVQFIGIGDLKNKLEKYLTE
ncbi:MAG: HAD family phosphatase [Nitrospirae bacterium]|nr:HAD family phosphatase [Nitrospirota bacterium]